MEPEADHHAIIRSHRIGLSTKFLRSHDRIRRFGVSFSNVSCIPSSRRSISGHHWSWSLRWRGIGQDRFCGGHHPAAAKSRGKDGGRAKPLQHCGAGACTGGAAVGTAGAVPTGGAGVSGTGGGAVSPAGAAGAAQRAQRASLPPVAEAPRQPARRGQAPELPRPRAVSPWSHAPEKSFSSSRLSSRTLTRGSPKIPRLREVVCRETSAAI